MIKRVGTLAVPGEFKYGDVVETKTPEELRLAAQRQPIVALTYSHPHGGIPHAADIIGTVSQDWSEKDQRVMGNFWFFEEKIPPELRQRLESNQPIPISAGFVVDSVENGTQRGLFYTHVAVLKADEDALCPLKKGCGVNVRMEAESNPIWRFEAASDMSNNTGTPAQAPPAVDKKTVKETEAAKEQTLSVTKEQLQEMVRTAVAEALKSIQPAVTPQSAEQKPGEQKTSEPKREEQAPIVSEKVIPVGPSPSAKRFEVGPDGWVTFVPRKKETQSQK